MVILELNIFKTNKYMVINNLKLESVVANLKYDIQYLKTKQLGEEDREVVNNLEKALGNVYTPSEYKQILEDNQ